MTIAIVAGFANEAETVDNLPGAKVFMGADRDHLDDVIPADTKAILAWGTAGALVPPIGIGDICITTALVTDSEQTVRVTIPGTWALSLKSILAKSGLFIIRTVTTFSSPLLQGSDPASRLALNKRTHASTCEEIAFAVAAFAIKHNIPWANVNGISDTYDQTVWMTADMINPDGSLNAWNAMRDLVQNPDEFPIIKKEAWTALAAIDKLRSAARVLAAANWGF